jgi:hypothetical protein
MSRSFIPEPALSPAPPTGEQEAAPPQEFEFVLGRRQIASVGLVGITLLAIFTVLAYMAGKSTGKTVVVEAPAKSVASAPAPSTAPAPAASTVPAVSSSILDAPLSNTPEKGKLYIQLGHVERGFATLMVNGARKLGFPAFIAAGSTANVYRVLSGPFEDPADHQRAKAAFSVMGLNTFERRYSETPEATPVPEPQPAQP